MPPYLDPAVWLGGLAELSRGPAALVLLTAASMLVLGLRGFRAYICLIGATLGFALGALLADLMSVRAWTVGLPAGLLGAFASWLLVKRVLPLAFAFWLACVVGLALARWLELPDLYWLGALSGAVLALGLWLMAPRFSTALLYASLGTLGVLGSIGAVVQADDGPLAAHAVSRYPLGFTLAGVALFLSAMVLQVAYDDYDKPTELTEVTS